MTGSTISAAAHLDRWWGLPSLKSAKHSRPRVAGSWAGSSRSTPGQQLTGTIMGAFVSYVLVPQEQNTARLLLKVVMQATRWPASALCVGDLVMARRQLLNLKQLAERHQHRGTAIK